MESPKGAPRAWASNPYFEMLAGISAAIGIARRKGLGKSRHLDVTDLWIQDRIKSKAIHLSKVAGAENVADILTKYV